MAPTQRDSGGERSDDEDLGGSYSPRFKTVGWPPYVLVALVVVIEVTLVVTEVVRGTSSQKGVGSAKRVCSRSH